MTLVTAGAPPSTTAHAPVDTDIGSVEGVVISFEESGVCKTHPYLDPAGIPTIGYGSIWDRRFKPSRRVTMDTPPVDEQTARIWLADELRGCFEAIAKCVRVSLTQNQLDALEDFVYNLGSGNFQASTLLRKLNSGDYAVAGEELEKWTHAGGKELAGLVRRRHAEHELFDRPDATTVVADYAHPYAHPYAPTPAVRPSGQTSQPAMSATEVPGNG